MTTSRSKAKPKKKEKPIPSNIKQRCLSKFQRLRRLQEKNYAGNVICISCEKEIPWQASQGGHYVSRGIEATCIEPDNVWPQCPQCNGPLHGNYIDYRKNLVKRIGEDRVKRLENMKYASRGDEEAMDALSPEDQVKVIMKKGKVYWKARYDEFNEEIKKLESQL